MQANNGGDWKEEVYQKIRAMKELYLHDLNDLHHKVLSKLQQYESIPQQPTNKHIEELKVFKNKLECFIAFLQVPKESILAIYKDKLGSYEKQLVDVIDANKEFKKKKQRTHIRREMERKVKERNM